MVYFVKVGSVKDIVKDKFRRCFFWLIFPTNSRKKGSKCQFMTLNGSLLRHFNSTMLILPADKKCLLIRRSGSLGVSESQDARMMFATNVRMVLGLGVWGSGSLGVSESLDARMMLPRMHK